MRGLKFDKMSNKLISVFFLKTFRENLGEFDIDACVYFNPYALFCYSNFAEASIKHFSNCQLIIILIPVEYF